jgi:hypothetical protein
MVSSCYYAKGKNVMQRGLSTKLQLNLGIIFAYIKPRETLLSGEILTIRVIAISKIITTKATEERCSRTKSFSENKLRLISQIDTYVE